MIPVFFVTPAGQACSFPDWVRWVLAQIQAGLAEEALAEAKAAFVKLADEHADLRHYARGLEKTVASQAKDLKRNKDTIWRLVQEQAKDNKDTIWRLVQERAELRNELAAVAAANETPYELPDPTPPADAIDRPGVTLRAWIDGAWGRAYVEVY